MADSNAHSRRLVGRHAAFLRGWRGSRTAAVMACVMAAANLLNCRGRGCLARLATGLCGSPRLPPWMHGGRHDNCGHVSWRGDRHYLLHGDSARLYCPGLRRLARLPPWMHGGRHDNCGHGGWRGDHHHAGCMATALAVACRGRELLSRVGSLSKIVCPGANGVFAMRSLASFIVCSRARRSMISCSALCSIAKALAKF